MQANKTLDPAISSEPTPPSEASRDRQFFVSCGMIISARLGDVEPIREAVESSGGKIVFQTVTTADLFLLRAYQVKKALSGDLSELAEIFQRKKRKEVE